MATADIEMKDFPVVSTASSTDTVVLNATVNGEKANVQIKISDLATVVAAGVGSALDLSGLLGKKIGFFTKSSSENSHMLQYVSETDIKYLSSGIMLAVSDTDYALISYHQNQSRQKVSVTKISGGLSIEAYNNVGTIIVTGATKYYIIPIYY